MKKLWLLMLCGALLLGSTGCVRAQMEAEQTAYSLYFQAANLDAAAGGDALKTEAMPLENGETMDTQALAETLLTALLAGPGDETLVSPIPQGTQLLSVTLEGSHAQVDLSGQYSALSGVELTLADYCIAMTLCQLENIDSVSVTVRGQELAYRDTQNFSAADVLLSSTEDVVSTVEVTLYFLDGQGILTPERRTLELYEGDTQVESLLKALLEGPESKNLTSAIPEGFSVQTAWLEEHKCYVNLSSAALQVIPEGTDLRRALRALTASLGSLEAVEEVQYLVDGELTGSYGGAEIGAPFETAT